MMTHARMHLLRLGVCCVAGGLTYAALRRGGAGIGPAQAAGSEQRLVGRSAGSHERAADSPLATVRRLMRAGDVEGIRVFMQALAERDPMEFFKILRQTPYLGGLEGMREIIEQAGGHLAWQDPQALELLRQIGSLSWGWAAWNGYVGAQVGKIPDAEILDLALRMPGSSLGPLVTDAVAKRPREFMALLEERNCPGMSGSFFPELKKAHPELTAELLKAVPAGQWGDVNNKFGVMYAMTYNGSSPEDLMTLMEVMGGGSWPAVYVSPITGAAFAFSNRDQRDAIVDAIAQQPEPLKSAMLNGVMSAEGNLQVSDLDAVMKLSSSLDQQQKALEKWLKLQPDLDPSGQGWLDRLPTEKLRAKALELKNAVDDGVRRPPPLGR